MTEKTLTILGSTGSIGRNTLDVVSRCAGRFRVHALTAHRNVELLQDQIERHRPAAVVVFDSEAAQRLRDLRPLAGRVAVLSGMDGLLEVCADSRVHQVVSGMVGAIGLEPTYAAIERGKQVALANKETLVLAGELMVGMAEESGSRLLPMDSEHNAIFQCLGGNPAAAPERIVLTASGGPFRDWPAERFDDISLEQALAHPNWKMGPKITIDSATMMNKGLEVIEARWLFGLSPDRIQVLIHRQSIVHSMVEFADGSVIAQLGLPDMRTPISYCLGWPERLALDLPRLDLARVGRLDFEPVPPDKYPCLFLALEALELGGGAPAALNGANETVVAAYLERAFPFASIARIVENVMNRLRAELGTAQGPACLRSIHTVSDAIAADRWGREAASALIAN
jgi:1-deoxy-D-xylulose-5-phosphate reductoisomerase